MKRLFACLLVLALMLSIAPLSAFAEEPAVVDVPVIETAPAEAAPIEAAPAEQPATAAAEPVAAELQATGTCGDNLTWTLNDGTLRISGTGPMYDYVSTTCPWSGTMYASSVKHVVVESGVTTIGNYAFNVYGIETVSLPDTLTSIGKCAFFCNRKMESITIPEGVTSVGVAAFEGCEALKSVYLPDSLTVIPEEMFDGCPPIGERPARQLRYGDPETCVFRCAKPEQRRAARYSQNHRLLRLPQLPIPFEHYPQ